MVPEGLLQMRDILADYVHKKWANWIGNNNQFHGESLHTITHWRKIDALYPTSN